MFYELLFLANRRSSIKLWVTLMHKYHPRRNCNLTCGTTSECSSSFSSSSEGSRQGGRNHRPKFFDGAPEERIRARATRFDDFGGPEVASLGPIRRRLLFVFRDKHHWNRRPGECLHWLTFQVTLGSPWATTGGCSSYEAFDNCSTRCILGS